MNSERVKAVFSEIMKYEIRLAGDPRSLGPVYLQNTIAECRNHLNSVSRIMLEIHGEKQDVSRRLRALEAEHEIAFSEALANDERVKRLPSIEDRKATINVILREGVVGIQALKSELHDLEYIEKAVRHRHRELTSTMSEIKLQRSLIRDEIDSGAMYGDERQFDHERGSGGHGPLGVINDPGIDEDELEALLAQEASALGAPDALPPVVIEESVPTVVEPSADIEAPTSVLSAVDSHLSAVTAPNASPEDEAKVLDFLGYSPQAAPPEDFDDVFAKL